MRSNEACVRAPVVLGNTLTFTLQSVTTVEPVSPSAYGLVYFPNAAHTTLTIDQLRLGDLWETVDIKSMDGKQKFAVFARGKTMITIPVESLPNGFYIAVLRRKSGVSVYLKFLKI